MSEKGLDARLEEFQLEQMTALQECTGLRVWQIVSMSIKCLLPVGLSYAVSQFRHFNILLSNIFYRLISHLRFQASPNQADCLAKATSNMATTTETTTAPA